MNEFKMNMIALSTGHLTCETVNKLMGECELQPEDRSLIVYSKDGYGFFICIDLASISDNLPGDLCELLKYSVSGKADWLMLDRDAPINEALPFYEWE
jgi:hypothetical protein